MNPDEYQRMAAVQSRHWWFAAKRRVVRGLLRRHGAALGLSPPRESGVRVGLRTLDLGCGTGSMLPVMREWGKPVGMDAHLPALQLVAGDTPVVGGDLLQLPFPARQFRLIGCFDVLYHRRVSDVAQALREIRRVCDPNGLLIITDSAFPALRSTHDAALHGVRRFRLAPLAQLVESAGFRVVHRSYFHTIIFPVAAAVRLTKRLLGRASHNSAGLHSDLQPAPEWLNRLLGAVGALEAMVVRHGRLPWGLSVILLATPTRDNAPPEAPNSRI